MFLRHSDLLSMATRAESNLDGLLGPIYAFFFSRDRMGSLFFPRGNDFHPLISGILLLFSLCFLFDRSSLRGQSRRASVSALRTIFPPTISLFFAEKRQPLRSIPILQSVP